jgi:hypothetical protein
LEYLSELNEAQVPFLHSPLPAFLTRMTTSTGNPSYGYLRSSQFNEKRAGSAPVKRRRATAKPKGTPPKKPHHDLQTSVVSTKSIKGETQMKKKLVTMLSVFLSFLGAWRLPDARADEWDKKTTMTFNEPVEIPGTVLPAGTYIFKLADSDSNRHIVRVFSADQKRVYATILAISDERLTPTGKTLVTFEERVTGAPEAIKAWFYPGDNIGSEFVYPKQRAVELAKNTNQNVPAMTSETASSQPATPVPAVASPVTSTESSAEVAALKSEPVKSVTPEGDEVEIGQATVAQTLPKTASQLPMLALVGMTALFGILPVRSALKRVS